MIFKIELYELFAWKTNISLEHHQGEKLIRKFFFFFRRGRDHLTLGTGSGGLWAGLAAEGGGHDLWGQVEEVPQVLDALVGQVPVEVAPSKLLFHVPT